MRWTLPGSRAAAAKPEPRHLRDDERQSLVDFLQLRLGFEQLMCQLGDMMQVSFDGNPRIFFSSYLLPQPGVPVEKEDVLRALRAHGLGEISDEELWLWAAMLMLNEAYDFEGPDQDSVADIVNELAMIATPDVWLQNFRELRATRACRLRGTF